MATRLYSVSEQLNSDSPNFELSLVEEFVCPDFFLDFRTVKGGLHKLGLVVVQEDKPHYLSLNIFKRMEGLERTPRDMKSLPRNENELFDVLLSPRKKYIIYLGGVCENILPLAELFMRRIDLFGQEMGSIEQEGKSKVFWDLIDRPVSNTIKTMGEDFARNVRESFLESTGQPSEELEELVSGENPESLSAKAQMYPGAYNNMHPSFRIELHKIGIIYLGCSVLEQAAMSCVSTLTENLDQLEEDVGMYDYVRDLIHVYDHIRGVAGISKVHLQAYFNRVKSLLEAHHVDLQMPNMPDLNEKIATTFIKN